MYTFQGEKHDGIKHFLRVFFAPPKSYPRYSQGIAPKIANPGNPDVLQ